MLTLSTQLLAGSALALTLLLYVKQRRDEHYSALSYYFQQLEYQRALRRSTLHKPLRLDANDDDSSTVQGPAPSSAAAPALASPPPAVVVDESGFPLEKLSLSEGSTSLKTIKWTLQLRRQLQQQKKTTNSDESGSGSSDDDDDDDSNDDDDSHDRKEESASPAARNRSQEHHPASASSSSARAKKPAAPRWISPVQQAFDIRSYPVPWLESVLSPTRIIILPSTITTTNNHPSRGKLKTTPVVTGCIPFLGCAVEFGKQPLIFLQACFDKFGDVFTLHVAGRRLTVITNPDHFDACFFNAEPVASFKHAIQSFVLRAVGIDAASIMTHHKDIHDLVKGKLAPSLLAPFIPSLASEFRSKIASLPAVLQLQLQLEQQSSPRSATFSTTSLRPKRMAGGFVEVDLLQLVRHVIFRTAVPCLFGKERITDDVLDTLFCYFYDFDKDFEYGTQLPSTLLPQFTRAKNWMLEHIFRPAAKQIRSTPFDEAVLQNHQQALFQTLMHITDANNAPGYGLLLLWASQANSIPACFWTLTFIMQDLVTYERAKVEVQSAMKDAKEITFDMLAQMPFVKRCILEAVRLRSPGMITRRTTQDTVVGNYHIPKGDFLILSPYWMHHDSEIFDLPEEFLPDRWLRAELDKNKFLENFIGFGGGRYQCPGRWFALAEMQLFIAYILAMTDLSLSSDIPEPSPLHLVGVQEPIRSCRVLLKVGSA